MFLFGICKRVIGRAKPTIRMLAYLLVGMATAFIIASLVGWNHVMNMNDEDFRNADAAPDWARGFLVPLPIEVSGTYRAGCVEVSLWRVTEPRTGAQRRAMRAREGWPMLCLESRSLHETPRGVMSINTYRAQLFSGGFRVDWPDWMPRWVPETFMLRPVWPGFAVNSLIFGVGAWACAIAAEKGVAVPIRRLRSRLRTRAGLCAECGYNLAGIREDGLVPCPECGNR